MSAYYFCKKFLEIAAPVAKAKTTSVTALKITNIFLRHLVRQTDCEMQLARVLVPWSLAKNLTLCILNSPLPRFPGLPNAPLPQSMRPRFAAANDEVHLNYILDRNENHLT